MGGEGKAFATEITPASWYVLLDTSDPGYNNGSGTKIKYYHVANKTEYSNQWSNANTAGTTADNLNAFFGDLSNNGIPNDGDFVYIASGDYKLGGNYILLYYKTLHLYGGFAGTEITLSDRDLSNADNKTIIRQGSGNKSCFYIHTDSTIDSFTMTGGNDGGIIIQDSSPTITNCTITGNTATNNSGDGGISISEGSPTITNCTITGNTATNMGGGIYISGGEPKITNCTIVNNKSNNNDSHEIYFVYGTTTNLINTLIWNSDSEHAIVNALSTLTFDHCAYPNADNSNGNTGNINLTAWDNPQSSDVTVRGVKHIVYKIQDNYEALKGIICKGIQIDGLTEDQIGNYYFSCPPSIGAADINFRADISSGKDVISSVYGTEETLTFTAAVSLDNKALSTEKYAISWDTVVSPDTSAISIDQNGKLTAGAEAPAKNYDVTVKVQAVSNDNGIELKSNAAVKRIRVEIAKATINPAPGIVSKDLPAGKVSTDYSAELSTYFALTNLPQGTSTDWTIDGTLPDGLTCTDGVISGTPTKAGSFSFKVIGTATSDNYNTASKDIETSINIASGDMTLSLTEKSKLPSGKVATEYSAELSKYFTLTGTPEGASTSWTINGTLPSGCP